MNDITPKELKSRLAQGEELLILDVREEWEYEESNIGHVRCLTGGIEAYLKN